MRWTHKRKRRFGSRYRPNTLNSATEEDGITAVDEEEVDIDIEIRDAVEGEDNWVTLHNLKTLLGHSVVQVSGDDGDVEMCFHEQ